ncbi:MAG: glucokinase [Cyanophyceae cyanobacterium]
MLLLAGDIGGTKTILRLVEVAQDGFESIHSAQYVSGNYSDLVPIVQDFLADADRPAPDVACFAIAGPVFKNTSKLTNLSWFLTSQRLAEELAIKKVSLINDFAAVCYGIPGLKDDDLQTLQTATASDEHPMAVIGAGTGLGEGFLIPKGDSSYQVIATEGGHTDFAPRTELEWQLLQYIEKKYSISRVSVERVVSGQGIAAIYQFLRDTNFAAESSEISEKIRTWEQQLASKQERTVDPGAVISQAALEKRDRLCEKTMQMFVEAYGAEIGNLALKLLPYGGIYIAGGIAAKILPLMQEERFLTAFKQKGRLSVLLEQIPINVIVNPQVGLIGSVLYAVSDNL